MARKPTTPKTLDSLVDNPTPKMKTLRTALINARDNNRDNSYVLVTRVQLEVFCALTNKLEWFGGQKNSISETAKKKVDAFLLADGYEFNRTYQAKTWSQMVAQSDSRGFATKVPKSNGNGGFEKHFAFDCNKIDTALESGDIKIVITNPKMESRKGDGVAGRSTRKWYKFNKTAGEFQLDSAGKAIDAKAPVVATVTDPAKCNSQPSIKKAIEYWEKKQKDARDNLKVLREKQTVRAAA